MKICVSIATDSIREAELQFKRASDVADMIELRIDRIGHEALTKLLPIKTVPVLITNRSKAEGGAFTGTEADRLADLKRAVVLGADIVDIELSTGASAIAELRTHIHLTGKKTQLLVSYHDFSGTPADSALKRKINAAMRAGADIIKLVTFANRIEDNLQVLHLMTAYRDRGVNVMAFCMGELGRISRIAAPLFGAPFTFAAMARGQESAPGQIAIDELRKIAAILTNREENA